MKKDFISVKRYFKVLMCTGLILCTLSIVSCNNDNTLSNTESGELFPLAIKDIYISEDSPDFSDKNSPKSQTKHNPIPCFSQQKINTKIHSSDSSICFSGNSPWNYQPEQNPGNTQTGKNVLRSSENNLKSRGIGIFRLFGKGYPAAQNNIHYDYNYDENDWLPSDKNNPVYLDKDVAKLCAYYPYNSSLSDGNIVLTSQLYSDDADFCYQTGKTASSESGDVSFTLNHAYAKITFIFKREESYRGNGAVSKISISGENILSSNTLDIKTGSYGSSTSGAITVNPEISSISSGDTASTEVLIIPVAKLTDKITFTFTIDGSESVGVFSPSVDEFNKFEAGKNYKIKINLKSNIVIVTGETANCYMLAPGSTMQIPVNVKGNGNPDAVARTGLNVHHTAASVGILWETAPDLISLNGFTSGNQAVKITANDASKTGNAVIAAYSGPDYSGDILWSWHIWVTDYNPDSSTVQNGNIYTIENTNGSYTWMDRNLGATTVTPATTTTMGVLYQWGRKDPFPGASNYTGITDNSYSSIPIYNSAGAALTEESGISGTGIKHNPAVATTSDRTLNLKNSIRNPMVFYYGISCDNIGYDWYTATDNRQYQNDALWGGADNTPTGKTIFDPCPPGWRVPAWNGYSPWSKFEKDRNPSEDNKYDEYPHFPWPTKIWSDSYGRIYNNETFYPAAGYRNGWSGAFCSIGSNGDYWFASVCGSPQYSCSPYFGRNDVDVNNGHYRAHGFSIRCIRK